MRKLFTIALLIAVAAPAWSQAPDWDQLSSRQQDQLAEFRVAWPGLSDRNRQQLISSASQIARMPQANRQRLLDNMLRVQNMTPDEQRRIEEAQRQFEQLSENQKQQLRSQWQSMTPAQREAAIRSNGNSSAPEPRNSFAPAGNAPAAPRAPANDNGNR